MNGKAAVHFIILILLLFGTADISAASRRSPLKNQSGRVEKTALVTVPSSDVFARNSSRSERVTEVLLGDEVRVTREEKEWVYGYIPSQKGYRGWVRKKDVFFCKGAPFKDRPMVHIKSVKAGISFRDGSHIDAYAGTRLPLLKQTGERYEVILPDGTVGLLSAGAGVVEDEHFGKIVKPEDIMYAADFFGSDYKWGGITAGGMDCSGFVYTVFRVNGIFLKRDSYLQAEEGLAVASPDDLSVGDLVFFRTPKGKRISHVGIYVGHGNFIHASKGKKGVSVSSLSEEPYRKSFVAGRRILSTDNKSVGIRPDMSNYRKPFNKGEET